MNQVGHTYTVEATSESGRGSSDDEIDKLADYLGRYGVEDAAVMGLPGGQFGVTAQVVANSKEEAEAKFRQAAPWLKFPNLYVYEGEPA